MIPKWSRPTRTFFLFAQELHHRRQLGGNTGRKTNVRPYKYKERPRTFPIRAAALRKPTASAACKTLAYKKGVHKWKWKPKGCWLFRWASMTTVNSKPAAHPQGRPQQHRQTLSGLFRVHTLWQKLTKGQVWWIALKEERAEALKYLAE